MIRQTDIAEAFNAHLAGMPGRPATIWENQEAEPTPPYLVVEHIRTPPSRYTLDGLHEYIGRMQVAVVVASGTSTAAANDMAEAVVTRFAPDTSIPFGGGEIRILEQPWIPDGLQDGARYRLPVQIRYRILG